MNRSEQLREVTNDKIRGAINGGHLDEALGLLTGLCRLPTQIDSLASFIAKPYCSTYSNDEEVIEKQVEELQGCIAWMPMMVRLMELQVHRRRKALLYLRKGAEEVVEIAAAQVAP